MTVTTHFGLMVLFAFFASVVFSALTRDTPGEQARFGLRLFLGFIAAGVFVGWLLYPLPL